MYKITWNAKVVHTDPEDTEIELAQYQSEVTFENMKLLSAATKVVGQQIFQMAVQDVELT